MSSDRAPERASPSPRFFQTYTECDELTNRLLVILAGDGLPLPTLYSDEEIAVAVQEATGLPRVEWMALNHFQRVPWLQRTIAKLATNDERGPVPQSEPGVDIDSPEKKRMSREEVADRLRQRLKSGEKCPSQRVLANEIGCAVSTINDVINNDDALKNWAKKDKPAPTPRATSLDARTLDSHRDRRQITPQEEIMIREFVENANEKDRAAFLAMSMEDQLYALEGLDDHPKILGRKA